MYAGDEFYDDDVTSGTDSPDLATLERWSWDGEMEATDGCGPIEDDGYCEHGKPSWMRAFGLI
ncbi:MAG TPA: hypothetical protein VLM76_13355 [Patescibacteria group bacterium]|nr:hypothetical protein [Patescibacteria group bacterium]